MANKNRDRDGGKARRSLANKNYHEDAVRLWHDTARVSHDDGGERGKSRGGYGDTGFGSIEDEQGGFVNLLYVAGTGKPMVNTSNDGGIYVKWHSSGRGGGLSHSRAAHYRSVGNDDSGPTKPAGRRKRGA